MALSSNSNFTNELVMTRPIMMNSDGTVLPAGQSILTADNRGFRYGDGLFETMLVGEGRIRLWPYHFERLLSGMRMLRFEPTTAFTAGIERQILELCAINGSGAKVGEPGYSRVRLTVFRGDGSLSDSSDTFPHYIIQSSHWPAGPTAWNTDGLVIDIFADGHKACDGYATLKSNNYLLYSMAALYARQQGLDDCLVLNSHGRLADSTIANLFYIKDGRFYTPPLSEGCVAGVMRRYLLETLPRTGYSVQERPVNPEELAGANEVFLTNALRGIRWVRSFRGAVYGNYLAATVHEQIIQKM